MATSTLKICAIKVFLVFNPRKLLTISEKSS